MGMMFMRLKRKRGNVGMMEDGEWSMVEGWCYGIAKCLLEHYIPM